MAIIVAATASARAHLPLMARIVPSPRAAKPPGRPLDAGRGVRGRLGRRLGRAAPRCGYRSDGPEPTRGRRSDGCHDDPAPSPGRTGRPRDAGASSGDLVTYV